MSGNKAVAYKGPGVVDRKKMLAETRAFLAIQESEARWWRDASIAYFQSVSGRPLPPDVRPPEYPLDHYKSLRFVNVPGDPE